MDDILEGTKLSYCLYARKSSESDERQAMSIESQGKEMKVLAEKEGISILHPTAPKIHVVCCPERPDSLYELMITN